MDELNHWLVIARVPGLHAGILRKLLDEYGTVDQLVGADARALRGLGLNTKQVRSLSSPDTAALQRDLQWLEHPAHHLLWLHSPHYPALLKEIADAPAVLFVRGDCAALNEPQLAIVGSRNPTPTGREIAYSFAETLVGRGLSITSGLALGIDTASHRGALAAHGRTIAVCGTGLDIDYPNSNTELACAIEQHGALLSEFPLGTPPTKLNFPRRNRIISALSLGTLVVEAALQSGSLITARLAGDHGREVFAVPGSIRNPLSRGCHQLLRQGAKLVETAEDVLMELSAITAALQARTPGGHVQTASASVRALDKEYEILLDALGFEPAGVDILVERSGLRADEVASMLLILELEGRIESYPGGLFVRARPRR